jgi:hypothetical protein
MSIRINPVLAKPLALAFAFAATTALAGAAFAADMSMPLKAPPIKEVPFFLVNDTSVSFTWYPNATDPGVGAGGVPAGWCGTTVAGTSGCGKNSFDKFVGSVTHFDVWAYGTNFFNVDYLKSNSNDPIRGLAGASGAAEVYAFGRSTISLNAVTGTKWFSNWFFKDVGFEFGGDANTENNQLSPEVRKLDLGAAFTFNLPGTVILGVLAQKEWNYNSFDETGVSQFTGCAAGVACFTGDREFKWAPRLELVMSEPLTFLPIPLTWNSFTGVTFPKGSGLSGAHEAALFNGLTPWVQDTNETKTEVFVDNRLTLDISKIWWGKAGIWDGYVGWRYWYNKFGTDHNNGDFSVSGCSQLGTLGCAPGTSIENTVYLGTTYHFK